MAELIAVVHPSHQGVEEAHRALMELHDTGAIALLDEGFGRSVCQAMGYQGELFFALANSVNQVQVAMRSHGCQILHTPSAADGALAFEEGDNPQTQGQARRESGGESTEESGQ